MARKPDRFERMAREMVGAFSNEYIDLEQGDGDELSFRVAKLLRRQHRAYVRMVRDWISDHHRVASALLDDFKNYKR